MFATSFMNEMRVARIEFAAYLHSSALAVLIVRIGAPVRVNGPYSSFISRPACSSWSSIPMTTRSGFMKSSIAVLFFFKQKTAYEIGGFIEIIWNGKPGGDED